MNVSITKAVEARDVLEKVLLEEVGPRCPDYEPYCVVCEAWLHFDGIKGVVNDYIDTQELKEELK